MTGILALAVVAAGLAMILGARETAKKIGFAVLTVILGLSLGRCLLCWLAEARAPASDSSSGLDWFWPFMALVLIAIGGIAWKTRLFRQRRLADLRGRHMHPRRPAPLPPPSSSADHGERFL